MTELTIQLLQDQFEDVLKLTGENSFVNWEQYSKDSNELLAKIDQLNNVIQQLKESHQKEYIQNMKKLKSLDVPDVIKSVKAKKLPKQALKTILPRFQLSNGKVDLKQNAEQLRNNAHSLNSKFNLKNVSIGLVLSNIIETIKVLQGEEEKPKQKPENVTKQQSNQEHKEIIRQQQQSPFTNQQVAECSKNIVVNIMPNSDGLMGGKTYAQIVQASEVLITKYYVQITLKARKAQRANRNNPQAYLDIMNRYMREAQALVMQGQIEIAKKIGFTKQKFEASEQVLMQRGFGNNMMKLQSDLRAKLKEAIPTTKSLGFQDAKKVIEFQARIINEKADNIVQILSGLPKSMETAQLIPMLLTLILNDYVLDEYGFEEEDYMKHLGDQVFLAHPELGPIFQSMQISIMGLMQKLKLVPENMAEYMQQGMLPPEMMQQLPPGVDPNMVMQQMQQMQALYQQQQQLGKK